MAYKPLMALLRERVKTVNRRLLAAMACYLVLILVALYALLPIQSSQEGFLLGTVLFIFAILIIKTLVHAEDNMPE